MYEIEVSKAFITAINILILLGLPFMFFWHVRQVKRTEHLSYEWMIQIIILFCYSVAISSEVPALWSRWVAYYTLDMQLPDGLYKLTMWDRWNHAFFYAVFYLLTRTVTLKRVPKIIKDTLS